MTKTKITDRVDAITSVTEEWARSILPAPKAVKIELTSRCDFGCLFCVSGLRLRRPADIEWNLLTRLLLDIRRAGVDQVGLFYLGESLLYPRVVEAIEFARLQCGYPYIFLTTNGRLATEARVYACAKAGLDSLKFSLNAADRKQFQQMMRIDAFDDVVANIKSARVAVEKVHAETGHRCGLYVSSILHDEEQEVRMQGVLGEIAPYVDQQYLLPHHGHAEVRQGARVGRAVAGAIGRVGALREPLPCWSLFTEAHITVDGHLSACCWDHDGRFSMGDLTKTTFMEAWNSGTFQELRLAHLRKDVGGTVCHQCVYGTVPTDTVEDGRRRPGPGLFE